MCESEDGSGLKLIYCETDEKTKRRKCTTEGAVRYFGRGKRMAYIRWFGAEPQRKGYGSRFFAELEEFLEKKKCVKRLTLHALPHAEGYWERMGFVPLETPFFSGKATPLPEDDDWLSEWQHRPYEKELSTKKGCKPLDIRSGVLAKGQTLITKWAKKHPPR